MLFRYRLQPRHTIVLFGSGAFSNVLDRRSGKP